MTPSQHCKLSGLNSLVELSHLTGVSAQTLINWSKHKPVLFKTVLAGAVQLKRSHNDNQRTV